MSVRVVSRRWISMGHLPGRHQCRSIRSLPVSEGSVIASSVHFVPLRCDRGVPPNGRSRKTEKLYRLDHVRDEGGHTLNGTRLGNLASGCKDSYPLGILS